jgi:hypothetical protein
MQARIARETLYAPAIKRHALETVLRLYDVLKEQGDNVLERGYAQDVNGASCQSTDPEAVRWSAYGLYERVLRERFPITPVYRFHMHNVVGSVVSNVIGLSAEFLHQYNPELTGRRRINRGMDWLIFEAQHCSDVPYLILNAAKFMNEVPAERVVEVLTGKPGSEWTPTEYPEGAKLVDVEPEHE